MISIWKAQGRTVFKDVLLKCSFMKIRIRFKTYEKDIRHDYISVLFAASLFMLIFIK
jgi:hypothetical protein